MSIDFEQEKREELDGANDAKKLSEQVVKLQELEAELLVKEQEYKEMKRKVELVSAEVTQLGKGPRKRATRQWFVGDCVAGKFVAVCWLYISPTYAVCSRPLHHSLVGCVCLR